MCCSNIDYSIVYEYIVYAQIEFGCIFEYLIEFNIWWICVKLFYNDMGTPCYLH